MLPVRDDCFAMGSELMPLAEALDVLAERIAPVADLETVPIRACHGRVLAADVVADRDVPPHDNVAVDGYAVFYDDLNTETPTRLPVKGRIAAGHPLDRPAQRGEALRVFTGAPMPAGPDTVFMEEDCTEDDGVVTLPPGIKRGANRRFRGEDVKAGSTIIAAGRRLRAQEVGLAASVGCEHLIVRRSLRAALFSTGDEIRDPGDPIPVGCVYDANRYAIMALLDGLGCDVTDLGILPDVADTIRDTLAEAAANHDLLITSGGMSLGEEDHVVVAVEALGRLDFWRLAIKPGRPVAMGQVRGRAFVGLPGNPVAATVTFMIVARPVILRLAGRTDVEPQGFEVRAGFTMKKKLGRREFVRARLATGDDGAPVAHRYAESGAGILTSMVESDGLVELPEDQGPLDEGVKVRFLPFSEVTA